jgi:hypothetical protein
LLCFFEKPGRGLVVGDQNVDILAAQGGANHFEFMRAAGYADNPGDALDLVQIQADDTVVEFMPDRLAVAVKKAQRDVP